MGTSQIDLFFCLKPGAVTIFSCFSAHSQSPKISRWTFLSKGVFGLLIFGRRPSNKDIRKKRPFDVFVKTNDFCSHYSLEKPEKKPFKNCPVRHRGGSPNRVFWQICEKSRFPLCFFEKTPPNPGFFSAEKHVSAGEISI